MVFTTAAFNPFFPVYTGMVSFNLPFSPVGALTYAGVASFNCQSFLLHASPLDPSCSRMFLSLPLE